MLYLWVAAHRLGKACAVNLGDEGGGLDYVLVTLGEEGVGNRAVGAERLVDVDQSS